ncbi:MAG TPA: hypothetical protein VFO16_21445 [Pseudonocardiaceae bacterium]|nr:hypothetical protein [Pseudonocardiaceae bacterium]
MSDVSFIALTIAVFAVMALVVRGVERLIGPVASGDRADSLGDERYTAHQATGGDDSGGRATRAGAAGMGVLPDGRVVR